MDIASGRFVIAKERAPNRRESHLVLCYLRPPGSTTHGPVGGGGARRVWCVVGQAVEGLNLIWNWGCRMGGALSV